MQTLLHEMISWPLKTTLPHYPSLASLSFPSNAQLD